MIQVYLQLAVDDADILQTGGSQLRRAPFDGEYRAWMASDQADGQISVSVAGMQVVEASELRSATVAVLDRSGPPDMSWKVTKGDDVIMNYNEVTAGTASLYIQALDMVDIMMEAGHSPSDIAAELGL